MQQDGTTAEEGAFISVGAAIASSRRVIRNCPLQIHSQSLSDTRKATQGENTGWPVETKKHKSLCFFADFGVPFESDQAEREGSTVKLE